MKATIPIFYIIEVKDKCKLVMSPGCHFIHPPTHQLTAQKHTLVPSKLCYLRYMDFKDFIIIAEEAETYNTIMDIMKYHILIFPTW